MHASDCPQVIIPVCLLVTPDLVIYNRNNNSSYELLENVSREKEFREIQSDLGVTCSYSTIEISVMGHYFTSSLSLHQTCINFIYDNSISIKVQENL